MFKLAVAQRIWSPNNSQDLLKPSEAPRDPEKPQVGTQKGFVFYWSFVKRHWIISSCIALAFLLLITLTVSLVLTLGVKATDHAKDRLPGSSNHLPSYPLAVKNPYVSTWLSGASSNDVSNGVPQFYTEEPINWNVMARIGKPGIGGGTTYTLFGHPRAAKGAKQAVQQGPVTYTSTHTYVHLAAGDVSFVLDFFSPVSPENLVRHSMPYSYLTVEVSAPKKTDVQVFSAIDHTWTAQGPNIAADLSTASDTTLFQLRNPKSVTFSEREDRAQWGTTVFATRARQSNSLSTACDTPENMHQTFSSSGGIGTQKAPFNCKGDAIFGFAHQLKAVKGTRSVTFAVGLYREQAVNYLGKPQAPYFRSKFPDIPSSINAFFNDYEAAWKDSQGLDKLVRTHATQIAGANYADILEASVRQSFGALEVTIPADTLSTKDMDVNAFLKEISSDGNVNSVDVIYPTFPILYVLSPRWIKLLLQPILNYLNHPTGVWSLDAVPHDLGNHYPNATGHNDNHLEVLFGREEWMPVQVTGATLSMLLAYTNATKDYDFVKRYMGPNGNHLLERYADNLVREGLTPPEQLTTVDSLASTANTTQLAMTAALGVSAMGAISNMANYTTAGARMTQRILNDPSLGAIDPTRSHFTYSYNKPESFSVMFPLFTDRLTTLAPANSFAPSYPMQSRFYGSLLDQSPLGMPYSSREKWAITDWNMWSAAITPPELTKRIVDSVHHFLSTMRNGVCFGTKYAVQGEKQGKWLANTARSTVGANFALWALRGHGPHW